MNEKNITILNNARMSQVIIDNIAPTIEQKKEELIQQLISNFRAENHDHIIMLTKIAKIEAFDELMNSFKSSVKRANHIAKEN